MNNMRKLSRQERKQLAKLEGQSFKPTYNGVTLTREQYERKNQETYADRLLKASKDNLKSEAVDSIKKLIKRTNGGN